MNIKSAIVIGISIIISFALLSTPLCLIAQKPKAQELQAKFEVHRINDRIFVVLNTQTGKCWYREAFDEASWNAITPR